MHKLIVTVLAGLFGLSLMLISVSANAKDPCSQFYGKGYCTDYIKVKTGKQQRGDAKNWKSDIKKDKVKKGDVAIFKFGQWGHVAYVEKVNKNKKDKPESVVISEWNWGSPLDSCAKGPKFGKTTTRSVPLSSVSGFWRPN